MIMILDEGTSLLREFRLRYAKTRGSIAEADTDFINTLERDYQYTHDEALKFCFMCIHEVNKKRVPNTG